MMTELDAKIINEAIKIYEENHITQDGLIIVKYKQKRKSFFHKKGPHVAFVNSIPVQAWKYMDSQLQEIGIDDESIVAQSTLNSFETYTYAKAKFIYKKNENAIYMETVFGSLVGRGWKFLVLKKGNQLVLDEPNIVWEL